jgi:hypothetical protein
MDIFREIKELGYTGGRTQGCYHIKSIKEYHEIETPGYKEIARPKIPYIKPLSSRKLVDKPLKKNSSRQSKLTTTCRLIFTTSAGAN